MLKTQIKKTFNKALTRNARIAIVRTNYHVDLLNNLETAARGTLLEAGVKESNIQTFTVPGSWELPVMTQAVAKSGDFDAIIAFGIILKGQTYHFEMIANEVARSLMQLSIDYSIPIALEVLAVFDRYQAEERAGSDNRNKGIEAANTVLAMIEALKPLKTK